MAIIAVAIEAPATRVKRCCRYGVLTNVKSRHAALAVNGARGFVCMDRFVAKLRSRQALSEHEESFYGKRAGCSAAMPGMKSSSGPEDAWIIATSC